MAAFLFDTKSAFRALNKIVKPLAKAGIGSPFPWGGAGVVVLETTGRKSGEPREVPLLGFRVGQRVIVSTVRQDSQWVSNLAADPNAGVWLNGSSQRAISTVKPGPLTMVQLDLEDGA